MRTLTAEQFEKAVELDPAWASKLTEPYGVKGGEITDYINLTGSPITHLSPLLHFDASRTSLRNCKGLKIAEGNFGGPVDFEGSGIEETKGLVIKTKTPAGFYCDLSRTPLAEKDPMLAVEIMTGSKDPKVWNRIAKIIMWSASVDPIPKNMKAIISRARKTKMMNSLKKGTQTPFEI
jgi:hypothetical protein